MSEQENTSTDLDQIWDLLRELDKKIDLHLQEEEQYKPSMLRLVAILEQSKGVITFIKYTISITAVLSGAWLWVHEHITFKGL